MHLIKKIINLKTIVLLLCFGTIQTQDVFTPVILLENSDITNRKNEFYSKSNKGIQLYGISTDNKYDKIWEYNISPSEEFELISILQADINGSGEKEIIALIYNPNSSSSIYVFNTQNNIPTGSPEIFQLNLGKSQVRPVEMQSLRWDEDKDTELIIAFGSPDRKVLIIDYVIDTIKIIKEVGKEFLLNTYGPVDVEVLDANNDKIDEVYIYSNSAKLERNIVSKKNKNDTYNDFTFIEKQIKTFIIYNNNGKTNEIACAEGKECYFLNEKKRIELPMEYENIFHLKQDTFLLASPDSPMQIVSIQENNINEKTTLISALHIYEKTKKQSKKTQFLLSATKKQALSLDPSSSLIELISLVPPYTKSTLTKKEKETIATKPLIQEEQKAKNTKENTATKADTLVINALTEHKIGIVPIGDYIFKELETTKKPKEVSLSVEELAFIWEPTNNDAGYHELEYKVTYNSKPKLQETNINNQLVVSTTTEEKTAEEKKIIYVNAVPELLISGNLDTLPIYSDFTATYEVIDKNIKDTHIVSAVNQNQKNPIIIENNSIFWKPETKDAGNNTLSFQISDGIAETIQSITVYIDTTKKEKIYRDKFIATTNQEFYYKLPHTKGNKYELVKNPENLRITKKGEIYWIPLPTQIDSNKVEVLITNQLDINKYILDIYVNAPPIISFRPTIEEQIEEGNMFSFVCQSFDMNRNSELTWSLKDNVAGKISISQYGEIVFKDSLVVDNILYTLELNDGIDSDVFNGILYINSLPEFIETPNEYIELGDTLNYLLKAKDKNKQKPYAPGEENKLFYNIISAPVEAKINTSNHLVWTPQAKDLGENNFIISVTDSIATAQQQFTIFVNDKPSIVSEDSLSIELGDTLKHLFFIEDLNKNSEFSYNIKTTLDEILFSRKTGTLTWIPDSTDLGLHNLEISVSDGFNQSGDTQKLKIYVYKNPELLNSPPKEAFVNVEYLYQPQAKDMNNQTIYNKDVFFELEIPDTSLSIKYDVENNIVTWIPSIKEIGTQRFNLKIKDSKNHFIIKPFDVQVILSPCENTDTLRVQNIDTLYQTIIDSIFIRKIDTLLISKTDTISQIKIDSIFIERTDTVKILIDEEGKELQPPAGPSFNVQYKKTPFERNNSAD